MKHLLQIDDRSRTGKHLLMLLRELSRSEKGIGFLSAEDTEDRMMAKLISDGIKSGIAPKKRVLSKLGI